MKISLEKKPVVGGFYEKIRFRPDSENADPVQP